MIVSINKREPFVHLHTAYEIFSKKDVWDQPSSEEAKISALSAQIKSLKDSNLKLNNSFHNAGKKKLESTKGKNEYSESNKNEGKKGKGNNKGIKEKDKWKLVSPTRSEKTNTVKDKIFHC